MQHPSGIPQRIVYVCGNPVYFNIRIAQLLLIKGGAHMCFVNALRIHASVKYV